MGTHVIIDARTRRVCASLEAPGTGTTIFAIDLIGDTWDDFSYFTEEARLSEQAQQLMKRNRFVRAAIAALFSHLDGIVSSIVTKLWDDVAFIAYRPKHPNFCSLKSKLLAVHSFLSDHKGLSLPPPDLNLKLLRDILNHPSVQKSVSEGSTAEAILLESPDVYGIGIEDLQAAGREMDRWLNATCLAIAYERFPDTKRLVEDFARALGSEAKSPARF